MKSILLSKTFWFQILTLICLLFPQVRSFIAANPVEFTAILAAANTIIRFITSGSVSLTGSTDAASPISRVVTGMTDNASGWVLCLGMGSLAGFSVISLSGCTTTAAAWSVISKVPFRACVVTPQGQVCYSSKAGIEVDVDATK